METSPCEMRTIRTVVEIVGAATAETEEIDAIEAADCHTMAGSTKIQIRIDRDLEAHANLALDAYAVAALLLALATMVTDDMVSRNKAPLSAHATEAEAEAAILAAADNLAASVGLMTGPILPTTTTHLPGVEGGPRIHPHDTRTPCPPWATTEGLMRSTRLGAKVRSYLE